MQELLERFYRYIAIDTQSNPENEEHTPSTQKQFDLAKVLAAEIEEMGLEAYLDEEHCYVYTKVESNLEGKKAPKIGFIAHMDTAPDAPGKCENPKTLKYEGGIIDLDGTHKLDPVEFPFLNDKIGKTLVTTDGTTLLGADDKAGVSVCMQILKFLVDNPDFKHGQVSVCFCPDEEIGHGASLMDLERFDADFAYTVDGGALGEAEFENFNAASVKYTVYGKNVHPGTAKNIMVNAVEIAAELNNMLPAEQKPQHTEGYEGFFMYYSINGSVEKAEVSMLIRDHSAEKFARKKELLNAAADYINLKYRPEDGSKIVDLEIKDSYKNMKEITDKHPEVVDYLVKAIKKADVEPLVQPIRGGTDGAQLSFRGLPCPNLFTGGYNFHGIYECLVVEEFEKSFESVKNIIELVASDAE